MYDAIIILGGGIESDGSLTDISRQRVERGIDLFHTIGAQALVLSGKWGMWESHTPPRTEAAAMKEYMFVHGIPDAAIHTEEASVDTIGNAYFTKRDVLMPNNWTHVAVVTSDYHCERTQYLFDRILGATYSIDYVTVPNTLPHKKLDSVQHHEKRVLSFLRRIVDDIQDDTGWDEFITKHHPGYAQHPTISFEQIRHFITG